MPVPGDVGRQKVEPVSAWIGVLFKADTVWPPSVYILRHTSLSQCGWVLWFLSVNTPPGQPHLLYSWIWPAEGQVMTSISPHQYGSSGRDEWGQTGDKPSAGWDTILIKHLQCNISWVSSTPTFATPENLIISQNIYYQGFNVTSLCQPLLWCMCSVKFCIILTNLQSWCLNSIFICHSSFIIAFQIIIFLVHARIVFSLSYFFNGGFSVSVMFEILTMNMCYMWVCEQKN